MADYMSLPDDLPVPDDDGAADHLPHISMPHLTLHATDGKEVTLDRLGDGTNVIYVYPLSGRPALTFPPAGTRSPAPAAAHRRRCGFRDHYAELQAAGVAAVHGLSSQATDYQAELAERLGLPFTILSDPDFKLAGAIGLPTFNTSDGQRLYKRLTMVITDGVIEHVFYPIFPPDQHAGEVLAWLNAHEG